MGCGEVKCIGPKAKYTDLWMVIWEEVHRIHQRRILLKAHRSEKEKHKTASFELFVTEGNERADEMAEKRRGLRL